MSSRNGMRNLGNTCYLNVAIQCLLSLSCLPILLNNVKQPHPPAIKFLMDCLCITSPIVLSPNAVYDTYLTLYDNKRHMPEDAVECFLRLTQYIEDNMIQRVQTTPPLQTISCACDLFWKNQKDLTLLKDFFYGVLYSRTTCTNCNRTTTKFETFQVLPIHSSVTNSISDGLIHLTNHSERIDSVECEGCKEKNTFTVDQTFHRLPKVLMFEIIGRNNPFRFDEVLVIQHTHGHENENITYRLKTLFLYNGSHYHCIAYDALLQKYAWIDDERVTLVGLNFNDSLRLIVYEAV